MNSLEENAQSKILGCVVLKGKTKQLSQGIVMNCGKNIIIIGIEFKE